MEIVFEVIDKTGRKVHLTQKQWQHITKIHHDMTNYIDEIQETLKNPLKITDYSIDEDVRYYYRYLKHKKFPNKYILVVVKYLNGEGFVITAYFEKHIK